MLLLKKHIRILALGLLVLVGLLMPMVNKAQAATHAPKYKDDFASDLTDSGWLLNPKKLGGGSGVSSDNSLRQNIVALFYPSETDSGNAIYKVIRDMTLGIMIAFFVWAGASILFNRKPEDVKKTLMSLVYILVGGVFVYGANRLFGDVLHFNGDDFTKGPGISGVEDATKGVFFVVLSALKAFAFFLAIIVLVITGFRVIVAGEADKGKKLVKGIINVVIALIIIKGIDFIYYIAQDSANFVKNAADLIVNAAKVFAYVYGVIIVVMVIIAGYFYLSDGGGGSYFKKASNILINILLSGLVLFVFLLILYQVFAEFQKGGDAVTDTTAFLTIVRSIV